MPSLAINNHDRNRDNSFHIKSHSYIAKLCELSRVNVNVNVKSSHQLSSELFLILFIILKLWKESVFKVTIVEFKVRLMMLLRTNE